MPRTYDPLHASLKLEAWPEEDRTLWLRALKATEPEDDTEDGRAAHWRRPSVENHQVAYGRWLNHHKHQGVDLGGNPADRVTPDAISEYLAILEAQGLKLSTRCRFLGNLLQVIEILVPDRDWTWLRHRYNRLRKISSDERQEKELPAFAGDVLDLALDFLEQGPPADPGPRRTNAVTYRNWLMVAFLTMIPLRRANFASLSIDRHLRRDPAAWSIRIPAEEMKTKRALTMPVPAVLRSHLETYLQFVRPILLDGRESDRLWIAYSGTPMSGHGIYLRLVKFTENEFGTRISPHQYRHIGATSTVIAAPDQIEAARALLGHGDIKTTTDFYIVGESVAASRQHADLIKRLRLSCPMRPRHAAQACRHKVVTPSAEAGPRHRDRKKADVCRPAPESVLLGTS